MSFDISTSCYIKEWADKYSITLRKEEEEIEQVLSYPKCLGKMCAPHGDCTQTLTWHNLLFLCENRCV